MKQIKTTLVLMLAVTTLLMYSCGGLEKMAEQPSPVSWSVKPEILEMQAGRVPVQITVNFPAKYFDKKALLVTRPIIKWTDGKKDLRPFTLQGESATDNNKTIAFETGGSFTYNDTVDFEDAMRMSELDVLVKASTGDKSVDVPAGKIGKLAAGVIATPLLVKDGMLVDNGSDGMGQTISQDVTLDKSSFKTFKADIHFALQQANLRSKELKQEDVLNLIESLKTAKADSSEVLKGINISSYASPDGPYKLNDNLSKKRGTVAKRYINKQFKKLKFENYSDLVDSKATAEDWDGFKTELDKSNIKDKDLIKRVLSMYSDPDVREKEIKNISEAYTDLKTDVLPQLRRSKLNVQFEVKARTPEEVLDAAQSDPSILDQKELFYAGTYAKTTDNRATLLKIYTEKYPNDWKGFNDLGIEYLSQNKADSAKAAFEKADELNQANGSILNNLGVLSLAQGNEDEAYNYFMKAKDAGENSAALNYNLGVLNIKKAKYQEAVTNFGATYTFNGALAQLLNKDNDAAMTTINEVEKEHKDAVVYYLKAVISARQGDLETIISSLRTAINKDAKWKAYALKDMEFYKYLSNAAFKAILQ